MGFPDKVWRFKSKRVYILFKKEWQLSNLGAKEYTFSSRKSGNCQTWATGYFVFKYFKVIHAFSIDISKKDKNNIYILDSFSLLFSKC